MTTMIRDSASQGIRRTKKCTRVADRAFPEVKVTWRQPGDFGRSSTCAFVEAEAIWLT